MQTTITVNGTARTLDLDPRTTLLDALREHLGLTGSKKGCDHGQCGACTVLVNGVRINSCLSILAMHDGDQVTTIEGLGQPGALHPVQQAFLEHDALAEHLAALSETGAKGEIASPAGPRVVIELPRSRKGLGERSALEVWKRWEGAWAKAA